MINAHWDVGFADMTPGEAARYILEKMEESDHPYSVKMNDLLIGSPKIHVSGKSKLLSLTHIVNGDRKCDAYFRIYDGNFEKDFLLNSTRIYIDFCGCERMQGIVRDILNNLRTPEKQYN